MAPMRSVSREARIQWNAGQDRMARAASIASTIVSRVKSGEPSR
jgi:hypothetical protein